MSCNNISSDCIVALSDYLKNNTTLLKLTISWNDYETPLFLNGTNKFGCMSRIGFGTILI